MQKKLEKITIIVIMKVFKIFNKGEKLYIGRSLIVNSLALLFVSPIIISSILSLKYLTIFDIELAIIGCFTILIGILSKMIGQFRTEKLKGTINGTVEFYNDKIVIKGVEYSLQNIKKVEIYANDYKRKWKLKSKYDFGNALSNGVDNVLRITMNNEKNNISIFFLQERKNEINKIEKELVNYYKAGKIHWLKLIEILNINDYDEIQELKGTIR